ncbi:MAG: hypothetical protein K0U93_24670, partial [Gammaproteobacteria bacterium]|nr:hypothetical protein [Gammaproteobacteria bacterium]
DSSGDIVDNEKLHFEWRTDPHLGHVEWVAPGAAVLHANAYATDGSLDVIVTHGTQMVRASRSVHVLSPK